MRTAKTLIRQSGCPGWSETSLGAHSVCWFCHVAAQMNFTYDLSKINLPFSVHPRDKQDVASRLVLSSLAVAYSRKPGKFQGPMVTAFYIDIGFYTLGLEFDNGTSELDVRSTDGFEVTILDFTSPKCGKHVKSTTFYVNIYFRTYTDAHTR